MHVQSVFTSPKNVTIEWWFTGDAEGSGLRVFPVDSSEFPTFISSSKVKLRLVSKKLVTERFKIWLNNTVNTVEISVLPTQFTPNYKMNITIQSPNGAVALDPNSLTTTTGKKIFKNVEF
jgi:hypothetical protein